MILSMHEPLEHLLYATELVCDRLSVGGMDGEGLTTKANERSSNDKRHVATDQASRADVLQPSLLPAICEGFGDFIISCSF